MQARMGGNAAMTGFAERLSGVDGSMEREVSLEPWRCCYRGAGYEQGEDQR